MCYPNSIQSLKNNKFYGFDELQVQMYYILKDIWIHEKIENVNILILLVDMIDYFFDFVFIVQVLNDKTNSMSCQITICLFLGKTHWQKTN